MAIQMTEEQFSQLLDKISTSGGTITSSARTGNFSNCPARFNGNGSHAETEDFINKINIFKNIDNISDDEAITGFPLLLSDTAATWWQGIKHKATKFEDVIKLLREAFAPPKQNYLIYLELFAEKQDLHTKTDEFICKKRALLSQLPSARHDEESQLDLIYGLLNLRIREHVQRTAVTTFNELLEKSRHVETTFAEKRQNSKTIENNSMQGAKKKARCSFCGNRGHSFEIGRKRLNQEKNHNETKKTQGENKSNTISCYGCGKIGFYRSNCPDCKKSKADSPNNVQFYSINTPVKLGRTPPTIAVKIAGIRGMAYMDTAARTSIASYELLTLLQSQGASFTKLQTNVILADGTRKEQVCLSTIVDIEIGNRTLNIELLALPTARENRTLLGIDFLEKASIILNLPQRSWSFADEERQRFDFLTLEQTEIYTVTIESNKKDKNKRQRTRSPFLEFFKEPEETSSNAYRGSEIFDDIIPWALVGVETPPKRTLGKTNNDYSPTTIAEIFRDTVPASVITPPRDPRLYYGLYATKAKDVNINGVEIELGEEEGLELSQDEKRKINKLLTLNSDLFNPNKKATPYIEHFINLTNPNPIAVPPYRMSPQKRALLRIELDKMLENDIIEECESAWAAPVVLVPKKDGKIRVCVDYRQLNAVTIPDRYPLPRMDDLLQSAKSSKCMTTLDLLTGYWQVNVAEIDKDKTSFITPFGTFKFKRMPFGLRNAPSTFQRLIDKFRIGLTDICILAYLDDIIIISATFNQHLIDLEKVFNRLKKFELKLNREKCKFCRPRVNYLGHVITADGIKPNPNKVDSILKRSAPKTLKQLLSFIQTCSWYRRFIPNFADVAQPLTKLTKKNAIWKWADEQQRAWEKLKELLTTSPILQQADEMKPFVIKTDASSYALGAVLLQGEGAEEHPIEYASRLLSSAERNYSTTEREALAIVWAVSRFRGYIEDAEITVITDHQPLRWLMTMKSPSGRLARWALTLQAYHLKVTYAPGKTNIIADWLSRPECEEHEALHCEICSTEIDLPRKSAEQIREKQLEDQTLKEIITDLEDIESGEKYLRWTNMGYVLVHGVLYRYIPELDSENGSLVVPKSEQKEILKEYHDTPTAGHYGVDRTYHRIASRYFWMGMRQDVAKHIAQCVECQRYKNDLCKPAGLLQTTASNQRFEVVAVDLFGPLPVSTDNKRWILIVEDIASRWVELFALENATAEICATLLLEEIFLRYGLPRRLISDNGTQFIAAIMQHLTFCLGIQQSFTPVYHPAANPVERKNRDMKAQIAILVGTEHTTWPHKLAAVRFAMNTSRCESTGHSAAYLTFGRNLRTPDDVNRDLRAIVESENFIPQITPKLLQLIDTLKEASSTTHKVQYRNQRYHDNKRRPDPGYLPGDKVWLKTHTQSNAAQGKTSKFNPKRDGPYIILAKKGVNCYEVADPTTPNQPIGIHHTSAIRPYVGNNEEPPKPVVPIRKRGRPKKGKRTSN